MAYYRLMTSLPPLPDAPGRPPIPLAEVIEWVRAEVEGDDEKLVRALLWTLDCHNLEAFVRGVDSFDERAEVPRRALESRKGLPEHVDDYLAACDAGVLHHNEIYDVLWRNYFGFLFEVARACHSEFLDAYVAFEVSLRDQLVAHRAEQIGLSTQGRTSGTTASTEDHSALISALAEAANPLEVERLLDAARLERARLLDSADPFTIDALLAYLAGMLVLDRWDFAETPTTADLLEELV